MLAVKKIVVDSDVVNSVGLFLDKERVCRNGE